VKYWLRDRNAAVVEAWQEYFSECGDVFVSRGDILDEPADAIVSPANSFGFMDGGVDLAYSLRFGWHVEERLRELLRSDHGGELVVGQAVILETGDAQFPLLISAPTMRVPMDVSGTVNAYLAFRAVIRAIKLHNRTAARPIRSVLCPGLCTATGRMDPKSSAWQMYYAYLTANGGQTWIPQDLMEACRNQVQLVGPDEPRGRDGDGK
jgi:O-acetyl-ADP-ribose deacetylase (regulator of RNase III)